MILTSFQSLIGFTRNVGCPQAGASFPDPSIWLWGAAVSRSFLRAHEHWGEYHRDIGYVRDCTDGGCAAREGVHVRDHIVRRFRTLTP